MTGICYTRVPIFINKNAPSTCDCRVLFSAGTGVVTRKTCTPWWRPP